MMRHFQKLVWVVVVLGLLVSGYFGVERLRKRSEVRRELAPIIRTDQMERGEFLRFDKNNPSASVGEFYAEADQQVESRKERIKKLLMVDSGPYVKAQEALLDLMRKENEFVRTQVRFFRVDKEFLDKRGSISTQMVQMDTSMGITMKVFALTNDKQSAFRALCQHVTELRELNQQDFTTIKEFEQAPPEAEFARHEAVDSWNKAYGWIRWSGVSIEPSNSIRAYPPTVLGSDVIAVLEHGRASADRREKSLSDTAEKVCH